MHSPTLFSLDVCANRDVFIPYDQFCVPLRGLLLEDLWAIVEI